MNQGLTVRKSFWRFSLRELLLLMLAAGAFVGWGVLLYERSQIYRPSPLFEHLPYWQDQIAAALNDVGEVSVSAGGLPFTVTHARGPSIHQTETYCFPLPAERRDKFLNAFRQHVHEHLRFVDCRLQGEAAGNSNGNHASIVAYRLNSRVGAVHISMIDSADDKVRLIVTTHEEGSWRGDLSPGVMAGS